MTTFARPSRPPGRNHPSDHRPSRTQRRSSLDQSILAALCAALFASLLACHAEAPSVQELSADELLASPPTGAVLLDVRSAQEFASGHVPHAVNISYDELAERLGEVGASKSDPVIVYCESGRRAGMAANVLLDAGYTDVWHLSGDMAGWRRDGRPTMQETARP